MNASTRSTVRRRISSGRPTAVPVDDVSAIALSDMSPKLDHGPARRVVDGRRWRLHQAVQLLRVQPGLREQHLARHRAGKRERTRRPPARTAAAGASDMVPNYAGLESALVGPPEHASGRRARWRERGRFRIHSGSTTPDRRDAGFCCGREAQLAAGPTSLAAAGLLILVLSGSGRNVCRPAAD
jgi:hypothetical protein